MSLSQFASRVDHSQAEVRSWERGEAEPALDSRDALVDVLEVDPDVLDAVWPLPTPEDPQAPVEASLPEEYDDTFLAVGGVVAGVSIADAAKPDTSESEDAAVAIMEDPTEAIGAPFVVAAPTTAETAVLTLAEPEAPRRWNPIRELYDPNKPWLTYLRTVLTVGVLAILGVVLIQMLGQLFDALGELLDTVQTNDDVRSTIEALSIRGSS
jgi:transcriptional regulator with XRE-family HTH domain